ncbi:MAG: TlpA disulfide reductase family protein [Gemmatimonadota bacterium]
MPLRSFSLPRLLASLVLLCAACSRGDGTPSVAELGKASPPYTAKVLGGGSASLAEYQGKVVLLNVWATWCAPCRDEIPFLEALHTAQAARGLAVVGVSVDAAGSEQTIAEFRKDFGMTYPIWLDPDERVQSLFLALGVPASYIIDREGVLRWKHLGTVKASDSTFTRALESALGSGT